MNLTAFSVKNWQFTVIVFAMLAVLGLASWHSVPRMEDPALDFPTYTIVAVYPGASPIDLERLRPRRQGDLHAGRIISRR